MSIQFICPKCQSPVAFGDEKAGKPDSCFYCGKQFIVPSQTDQKPVIIMPKAEPHHPVPGFYKAVFLQSWKMFFNRASITGLVFVTAAVCFKFFAGDVDYSA